MHYTLLFRQYRERSGLSIDDLAKKADVHRNTVLNLERGRAIKFETLKSLVDQIAHSMTRAEVVGIYLSWVESQTEIRLTTPTAIDRAQQKIVTYSQSANKATRDLAEAIRVSRLKEKDIRMLAFVVEHPEIFSIVRSICDLVPDSEEDMPVLKVAEEKK